MALLKCSRCGKVMTYQPAGTAGRIRCSACGASLQVPAAAPASVVPVTPRPASPANPTTPPITPPQPAPRNPWKWLAVGALCATSVLFVVLIAVIVDMGPRDSEQRYLEQRREQLLALKADAERLALAGQFAQAHAKYREIEQIVGTRTPSDPALWDLLERAKQDQDSIYRALIASQLPPSPPSAQPFNSLNEPAPPARYTGFETPSTPQPTTAPSLQVATQPPQRPTLEKPPVEATPPQSPQIAQAAPTPLPPTPDPLPPTTRPANSPPLASPDPVSPSPNPPRVLSASEFEDARVGQAIQKGVDFLIRNFEGDQIQIPGRPNGTMMEGLNALCVYALLSAGQAIQDERLDIRSPFMRRLVNRMKEHQYLIEDGNRDTPVTYARALRACALAVHNRAEDRQALEDDVQWLVLAATDGAYTYDDKQGRIFKPGAPFIGPDDGKTLHYFDPEESPPTTWLHNGEWRTPGQPTVQNPQLFKGRLPKGYKSVQYSPLAEIYRNRAYTEAPDARWDNSNTQYGVLGVWAGAEVGVEVPADYWMAVEHHWMSCQHPTGEWAYNALQIQPYYGMTVAGIASLFVTHDYLDAPAFGSEVGREPFSPALARGLAWLEMDDNAINVMNNVRYLGYNLFGLERVGLASGFKYFGVHDWYRELALRVLTLQRPNGSWCRDIGPRGDDPEEVTTDALIDTAYILLFLSRGRHPVMINKLRFDGFWCNRPREIANLSKFASRELKRPLNWQVVGFQREWHDWMDSPILYIASHQAPKFNEMHYEQLRRFAEAGGLIFTHADGNSVGFNNFAAQLAKKLFPQYEWANLPLDHEVYSLQYRIANKPPLKAVTNGSRLLMVHSPKDLSTFWQVRNGTKRENWELPMNLFLYAAGKGNLRNRLSSPHIPNPVGRASQVLSFARLKYDGNWNPEPYAWERFSRYLRHDARWGMDLTTIELRHLKPHACPIVHLTGNTSYTPTDAEVDALRQYVEAGGTVLIDACGGSAEFAQSAVALLNRAFPGKTLTGLDWNHPLFTAPAEGMVELPKPQLRPYASGKAIPRLEILNAGKGRVLFSSLDLTTGLLGTNTWGILGYHPAFAEKLAKNIVLWIAHGAKE